MPCVSLIPDGLLSILVHNIMCVRVMVHRKVACPERANDEPSEGLEDRSGVLFCLEPESSVTVIDLPSFV